MKRSRLIACSSIVLAFALLAWAPAARARLITAAPAVHTATGGVHAGAHRSAHHAHHRGGNHARLAHVSAQLERRSAHAAPPAPRSPVRHRAERRAALPVPSRGHGNPPTPRHGNAVPASTVTAASAVIAVRIEALPYDAVPAGEGRVISGRGPPRASPFASLLPASAPGSLPTPRSAAPFAPSSRPTRPELATARAEPRPPGGDRASSLPVPPEPVSGRSHARRPEGAAACLVTPSNGEAR